MSDTPDEEDDGRRVWRQRPNPHWDNLSERRLDDLGVQLREARRDVGQLWSEFRADVRAGEAQTWAIQRLDERLSEMIRRIDALDASFSAAQKKNEERFVTHDEFDPVRKAVFTVIGAVCLAVLAAVGRLVMK